MKNPHTAKEMKWFRAVENAVWVMENLADNLRTEGMRNKMLRAADKLRKAFDCDWGEQPQHKETAK